MTKIASICAAGFLALVAFAQEVLAQGNGWSHGDVGSVGAAGNATYNAGTDTYAVEGAGAGTGGTADAFQYMSRTLSGDGTVVVRVVTQSNTGSGARAGLMIREGTAAGARNAFLHTTISGGLDFQVRSTVNGSSAATNVSGSAPKWLKLVREGTLISGFQSADGISWTLIDTVNLPLPYEVSVGVAVTSGNDPTLGTATFDHLQLTEVAGPSGLSGFYFHGSDLSTLRVIRRDGAVRFDWAGLTPDAAVESGDYSIRWKGEVLPAFSETYTFYTLADDKVRLWVDDQLIIDHWTSHSLSEDSGSIALTQGIYYHLKMEYAKTSGSGVAVLSWSSASLTKEVIPYLSLRNQDLDDDGMPDTWELAYGFDPGDPTDGSGDLDGDGVSNLQEYLNASDPSDYYNGVLPTLEITSGNNQSGLINTLLAQPLTVRVKKNGNPLSNAPVSFEVNNGGGSLADSGGGGVTAPATVRTDSQGYAAIHFRGAASPGESIVDARAISGTSSVLIQLSARTLMAGQLPLPLNGLRVWLKGNAGVAVDSNNKLSQWDDFSGNSYGASQTASGAQPQLVANAINGYPVVRFNGTSHFLSLPNAMSGATAGDMFVVLKATQDTPTSPNGFMRMGTHTYGANYPWTDQIIYDDFGSTNYHTVGNPLQPLDQYHLYNATSVSGKWMARINGKEERVDSANTVAFHASPLLGKRNYGECWAGDFAEILIFDRVLNAAERQAAEAYLGQKYLLVSAPATPTGLQLNAVLSTQVDLTWVPVSGATEFRIERKAAGETNFAVIGTAPGKVNAYLDSQATAGTTYTYRIIASTMGIESSYSSEASIITASGTDAFPHSGIALWLRADSGVFKDVNGNVSRWSDHSGLQNDAAQPSVSNQPVTINNALGGRPAMRFDGNDFVTLPNFLQGKTEAEMFVVMKAAEDLPGTWARGFMRIGSYPYDAHYPHVGQLWDSFGSTTRKDAAGDPVQPLDQYHLYNVRSKAGEWANLINGLPLYSTSNNTVGFSTAPQIGRSQDNFFAGDMAEILIYDHALTATERRIAEKYLGKKYGLVALPQSPTVLTVGALSPTQTAVSWQYPMGNSWVQFSLERKTANGPFAEIAALDNAASYIDTALAGGQTYTYRVRTTNYAGVSNYSAEVLVETPLFGTEMPLADIRLWLKGDSGTTSPLASWSDQSGSGNHGWQASSTSRATVIPEALNGYPVVRFDGNDVLSLPNFLQNATEAEMFVVLKAAEDLPSTNAKGFMRIGSYPYDAHYPHLGQLMDSFGSTARKEAVRNPALPLDRYHIYNVRSKAGEWANLINGLPLYSTSNNTVGFSTAPQIGRSQGYYFVGDMAEILIYDRALTAEERTIASRYLAQKYKMLYFDPLDSDHDGINDTNELVYGTDPLNPDTNGDGLWDGSSVSFGIDPTSLDTDGDSLSNSQEVAAGTNPVEADTDRDGVADNLDYYPLDPTQSLPPTSVPGAPVITLTIPAGLTLLP